VWHASVMLMRTTGAEETARRMLEGVGDSTLGEWVTKMNAVHVRRRLSIQEAIAAGLAMRDLRNTEEGSDRMKKLLQQAPALKAHAIQIGEWAC